MNKLYRELEVAARAAGLACEDRPSRYQVGAVERARRVPARDRARVHALRLWRLAVALATAEPTPHNITAAADAANVHASLC